MSFETILLEKDDRGVARLTLNRPSKHNALDTRMIGELRRAADALACDDGVRVVILGGAGKSFCAGGDIGWFRDTLAADRSRQVEESRELARMLDDLNSLPKPLIGRIHGSAYGGGVGMVAVCDIAIGAADAQFGLTEVRLGLVPANISPYVVARIGAANARATMLSGALFDAARAVELGLINDAAEPGALNERIDRTVTDHLQAAPGAVAATKRLISYVASHGVAESMDYTAEGLADAWKSEEGRTGITCFFEKRLPPWRSGT